MSCIVFLGASEKVSAADCKPLMEQFEAKLKTRDIEAARTEARKIAQEPECGDMQFRAEKKLSHLEITMAESLKNDPTRQAERERLLVDADRISPTWLASYALGDFRWCQRRFLEAFRNFEKAIETMRDKILTPKNPDNQTVQTLFNMGTQAKLLAASAADPKQAASVFEVTRDRCGGPTTASAFLRDVRGIRPHSVILPIPFATGSARLSPIGALAVREAAMALKESTEKEAITIVGHTDERGADNYNMKLSQRRAQTVAKALRKLGVRGAVVAEWRGKREPLVIEEENGLTPEDRLTLNRRVELRSTIDGGGCY
jgi:outer membrane protein OmpA-like peptidoglycan-associated protein